MTIRIITGKIALFTLIILLLTIISGCSNNSSKRTGMLQFPSNCFQVSTLNQTSVTAIAFNCSYDDVKSQATSVKYDYEDMANKSFRDTIYNLNLEGPIDYANGQIIIPNMYTTTVIRIINKTCDNETSYIIIDYFKDYTIEGAKANIDSMAPLNSGVNRRAFFSVAVAKIGLTKTSIYYSYYDTRQRPEVNAEKTFKDMKLICD